MFKRIVQIFLIIVMMGFLAYGGMCVYANFFARPEGSVDLPDVNKARYIFTIETTGRPILTNNYEVGNILRKGELEPVYIIHGYYELIDDKFKYRNIDLRLDEATFGKITVEKRR